MNQCTKHSIHIVPTWITFLSTHFLSVYYFAFHALVSSFSLPVRLVCCKPDCHTVQNNFNINIYVTSMEQMPGHTCSTANMNNTHLTIKLSPQTIRYQQMLQTPRFQSKRSRM